MKIIIKTKKHRFIWNYKKFLKNIAIATTIAITIFLYAYWFIQYNTYLNNLMK